jgi:hypothetical protein
VGLGAAEEPCSLPWCSGACFHFRREGLGASAIHPEISLEIKPGIFANITALPPSREKFQWVTQLV